MVDADDWYIVFEYENIGYVSDVDKNNIDAIITDWNMPNMSGLELVKRVRAKSKYKDMPILMVTTEDGKTEVITALKAGVNNYIVKPFTPPILKKKLEAVL